MRLPVNPLRGKTTNRRAGCEKFARPVRREGGPKPIGPSYPYQGWRQEGRQVAKRNKAMTSHRTPRLEARGATSRPKKQSDDKSSHSKAGRQPGHDTDPPSPPPPPPPPPHPPPAARRPRRGNARPRPAGARPPRRGGVVFFGGRGGKIRG